MRHPLLAWRLIKHKHAGEAFSGEGARRFGGRWNRRGETVVYVSDSLALAALELFVHLSPDEFGLRLVAFRVEIPGAVEVRHVTRDNAPRNWRQEPPPASTQTVGSHWLAQNQTAVLRVPSVIVPDECNYVLNPDHPDFKRIKVADPAPFSLDPRMWKA